MTFSPRSIRHEPNHSERTPITGAWISLAAGSVALLTLAAGLIRVRVEAGELPSDASWLDHLVRVLVPLRRDGVDASWLLGGGFGNESVWTRLFDAVLLGLNQQWDPGVWAVAALAVHALGAVAVSVFLMRFVRAGPAIGWTVGLLFVLQAGSVAPQVTIPAGAFYVLFSALQLSLESRTDPGFRRELLAWFAGLCAVLSAPVGVLSAGAVWIVRYVRREYRPPAARSGVGHWSLFGMRAATVLLGAGAWWPAWARDRGTGASYDVAAWFGGIETVSVVAVVSGVLIAIIANRGTGRKSKAVFTLGSALAVVFIVAAANRFIDSGREQATRPEVRRLEAVRGFVRTGELQGLANAMPEDATAIASLLQDERVRELLPPSLRTPLALTPDPMAAQSGFESESIPRFEHVEIPIGARGTFRPGEGQVAALFRSTQIQSPFPYLSFWASGTLSPPQTSLTLESRDGRQVQPLQREVQSIGQWRRLNFATPQQPFAVVASSTAGAAAFSFADPVEVGLLSRYANKVIGLGTVLLVIGGVSGMAMLVGWVFMRARGRGGLDAGSRSRVGMQLGGILPWVGIMGYVIFMAHHLDLSAGGSDSSGYRNSARLLASGVLVPEINMPPGLEAADLPVKAFVPPGFVDIDSQHMAPTYPVGVPLLYAAAAWVLPGDASVALVVLLHLLLGIVVTRELARATGLEEEWSWLAAAWIGLCPIYYFMGVQAMSDLPAGAWVATALWAGVRSRTCRRFAYLAGAATAMAVLVRPSNLLIALPMVIILWGDWRRLAGWIIGGLPGAAWQAFYAWRLYGSPFTTGYSNVSGMFDSRWVPETLGAYVHWWTVLLTPVVWMMIGFPVLRGVAVPLRVGLSIWVLACAGFYAPIFWTHETWWYQRYLLPVMPVMIVMALHVVRAIVKRLRSQAQQHALHPALITCALGVLISGFLVGASIHLRALYFVGPGNNLESSSRWVAKHAPSDAIVIAGQTAGSIYHYTALHFVRWDSMERARLARAVDLTIASGRRVFASLYGEESRALELNPDLWTEVAKFGDIVVWEHRKSAPAQVPGPETSLP